MYQLTLTNHSNVSLELVGGGHAIPSGGEWKSGNLADVTIIVPTRGTLSFHDIGDTHIGGDSDETWGVLIAYQGEQGDTRAVASSRWRSMRTTRPC